MHLILYGNIWLPFENEKMFNLTTGKSVSIGNPSPAIISSPDSNNGRIPQYIVKCLSEFLAA